MSCHTTTIQPFRSYVVVDRSFCATTVTVQSLQEGRVGVGDVLTLFDPTRSVVRVEWDDKVLSYPTVSVPSFKNVLHNGDKLDRSYAAMPSSSVELRPN